MLLKRCLTAVICAVCISTVTGVGSGQDQIKAVGETVSFGPTNINPPFTSIIWKHRSGSDVVKAIEWDKDDGFSTPNPRFKDITTLDEKTGQITITNLTLLHSGVYTIDINSKEQEQRFTLKVEKPVPKPEIEIERSSNPDVVFLRCRYNETIIWKNAAGETLKGFKDHLKGEFITVEKQRNPENFYTCTLKNDVSEKTSDPVYERDLFKEPVPKPEIEIKRSSNPDVVNLRCHYNETIIWKNAAGEKLKGSKNHLLGEFIKVENTGNPENFYTCTLKNDVSEKTSDPVYERDLFKGSNGGLIAGIIIIVIILIVAAILICVYLLLEPVYNRVNKICPCLQALLDRIGCCKKRRKEYNPAPTGDKMEENPCSPEHQYEIFSSEHQYDTLSSGNKMEENPSSPEHQYDTLSSGNKMEENPSSAEHQYEGPPPMGNKMEENPSSPEHQYETLSLDNEMGSGSSSQGQKSGEETPALAE